ncbi:unnamed protein product [Meganyctiphanes norvegica]|uniref:Phospholipase A2 n=1 Tax=Meganyctiphanes norvegica TaxID=48144 RepID=A0AAV2R432_MEGNR
MKHIHKWQYNLFDGLLIVNSSTAVEEKGTRVKRFIGQFSDMITRVTRRNALLFNAYGNHCGFSCSPLPPIDDLDRCCQGHDKCYAHVSDSICSRSWVLASFIFYNWSWDGRKLSCNDVDRCHFEKCMCDKKAAECFANNSYDRQQKKLSILDILITKHQ